MFPVARSIGPFTDARRASMSQASSSYPPNEARFSFVAQLPFRLQREAGKKKSHKWPFLSFLFLQIQEKLLGIEEILIAEIKAMPRA